LLNDILHRKPHLQEMYRPSRGITGKYTDG